MMLVLMLCALFTRTLVPAGWMPAIAGEGYTITLCTGAGAMLAIGALFPLTGVTMLAALGGEWLWRRRI